MMKTTAFVKISSSIYLIGLLLVGSFNALIDPYAVIGAPGIEGLNTYKPSNNPLVIKNYQVAEFKPEGLVLGTSRTATGIDPGDSAWGDTRAYNLAIPGSTPYEALRSLQHAHAISPVKTVVIGLDLFAFNRFHPINTSFDDSRLATDADGQLRPFWHLSKFGLLISWDMFKLSLATVSAQSQGTATPPPAANGFVKPLPLPNTLTAFRQSERFYLTGAWFPEPKRRFSLGRDLDEHNGIAQIHKVIRFAARENIDVYLFISPSHARHWEAVDAAGLWPEFENWKRQLSHIVAQREPGQMVALWDFSGANQYSVEAVAADGAGQEMQWYLESSHYRDTLGHLVLDRMLASAPTDGFGKRLSPDNLELHLEELRRAQQLYRSSNPEDVADIARLRDETAAYREAQARD